MGPRYSEFGIDQDLAENRRGSASTISARLPEQLEKRRTTGSAYYCDESGPEAR
jgi:hypothetical protein